MAESLHQNDPDMLTVIIDQFEATYNEYKVEKLFPNIKCPVLILQGNPEQDGLIRNIDVEMALSLILKAKYIKIISVGHALHMQDKDAIILTPVLTYAVSIGITGHLARNLLYWILFFKGMLGKY